MPSLSKPPETILQGDKPIRIRDVVVHEFNMGDVEDPDLYAAEPLLKFEQSDKGKWVMNSAVETPWWRRATDVCSMGWKYQVVARLSEADEVYFKLKFE